VTRQSNYQPVLQHKNPVDIGLSNTIGSGHEPESLRQGNGDKAVDEGANERGTTIHPDAWEEWISVASFVYHRNPEADLFDVFEWIRLNINGGTPNSQGLINRVTNEIEKELGPW
jgi:hypothetical protein